MLLIVLGVGPFFRGLFFSTELLASIVLVSLAFLLWLVGCRLERLPIGVTGGAAGCALLALLGCYLVQFAWAVYPHGNLDWVLRVTVGWMAYVLVRNETGPRLRRVLGWLFVLSAFGVAVMGLLEYAGYFARNADLVAALNIVNLGDRMYTPFQYPNTAASYLLAAVFAALGLALEDLRPWKAGLSTGLISLLSIAFFFTLSRGAVVVLPFGLLALFVGLGQGKRGPALLLLLAAWLPVLAILRFVGPAAAAGQVVMTFGWAAAASAVGMAAGMVVPYFLRRTTRVHVVFITLVAALGITGFAVTVPAGGLLPPQAARLLDISLHTPNAVYRFTLFHDSLEMILDQPLGRGGWGWERSYRQYQETYYVGRETHNHYLQTAVEAGVPGLLALGAAMATALLVVWRDRGNDALTWCLGTGAILIAGHSVIEFNLSFGLIWLLFWVLLASGSPPMGQSRVRFGGSWAPMIGSIVVAGLSTVLLLGSVYLNQADAAYTAGQQEEAATLARKAFQMDRWNSESLLIVGDRAALQEAVQLDPYSSRAHWQLSVFLQNQGEWELALEEARKAAQYAPLQDLYANRLASVAGKLMGDALHSGNPTRARELADEIIALAEAIDESRNANGAWMGSKPSLTPESRLRYGQALFLSGEELKAEALLKEAAEVGLLSSEADVWLYAIYVRQGNHAAAAELERKPWVRFRNVNPTYKVIMSWPKTK